MKNIIIQRLKTIDVDFLAIGKGYLSGLLGALTVFAVVYYHDAKPSKVATVNITAMVDQFIKQEAKKNLPQEVLKSEVKTFGKALEKELQELSKKHHLVLLPSEAVIAGSKDYTVIVRERMARKMQYEDVSNVN